MYIGGGITIGGIWIAEPVVSKILATLGGFSGFVPGGIAFDYNYIMGAIGMLVPTMSVWCPAVQNMRWQ